jgi:GntR family transcriptional regulator
MSPNPAHEHPFKRVANELRAEILRGDLAPGDKLLSENELAARFAVTRATVRKGIALLRMEGLVTTQQGKGAFVRERPHVKMLQVGSIYRERRATGVSNYNAEAAAQGQQAKQTITEVSEVPAPKEIAKRLEVEVGELVVVRRRLATVDDSPMQLMDGYYERDLVAGTSITEPRPIKGGANAVIEDPDGPIGRRIVQFVEDLDIRMPQPFEAEQLDIPAGVPIARILRTAYDSSGKALEVLDSRVPTDRHVFRYVIDV